MTRNQVVYVQMPQYFMHELLDDLGTYWTHKSTAVNAQVVVEDMIERYRARGRAEVRLPGIRRWKRNAA
jgi:hypothetical protein